ncbi:hypothetical protein Hanom_Chr03g00253361 [Helianthus anomalus]
MNERLHIDKNTGGVGLSWMGGEVLPIISLSCLRAGGGRVSAHLGEPRVDGGRVVDLGHSARCHGGWHVVPSCSNNKICH